MSEIIFFTCGKFFSFYNKHGGKSVVVIHCVFSFYGVQDFALVRQLYIAFVCCRNADIE